MESFVIATAVMIDRCTGSSNKQVDTIAAAPVEEDSSSSEESESESESEVEEASNVHAKAEEALTEEIESDSDAEPEISNATAEVRRSTPKAILQSSKEDRRSTPRIVPQSPVSTRRSSTPKPLQPSPGIARRSVTPKAVSGSPVITRRSATPKAAVVSQTMPQSGTPPRIDDEVDIETQSRDSSIRDSRSPVVYTQQEREEQDRLARAKTQAGPEQSDDSSSSDSEDDVEMLDAKMYASPKADVAIPASPQNDIEMEEARPSSKLSSPDSLSNSDSDDNLPVPKLTPRLNSNPAPKPSQVANPLRSTLFHHLVSPSNTDSNASPASSVRTNDTQDEVDYQLISSVYEASSPQSRPSLTQPAQVNRINRLEKTNKSSPVRPPAIQFGSSLSLMNAKKVVPGSQLGTSGSGLRSSVTGKPLLKSTGRDDSDDSSSDEDSDSDESTSPVNNVSQHPVGVSENSQRLQAMMEQDSSSDSESGSGSDSGSESEEEIPYEEETEAGRIRKELMAEVAKLHASQGSSQSPVLKRKKK